MGTPYDLKSKDDVKEYLENLGIEYRFSCYSEKKPDGCHLLGDYLEAIKTDFPRALKVYKSNCDNYDYGPSCYKYGAYRHIGRGSKKDEDVAYNYFEKGCKKDHPSSCLLAGVIATSTNTANENKRDYVKGVEYLSKSCLADNGEACHTVSSLYIKGNDRLPKDMKMAFQFATKGCQLLNVFSCVNLSLMYKNGEGTEKNEILAEKFKRIAIELKNQNMENFNQVKFGES